jgi:predicted DNA-binding protein
MLTLRASDELELELKSIAHRSNRKQSDIMRAALTEYLEDMEDYLDAKDALQEIHEGKEEVMSLDNALKQL